MFHLRSAPTAILPYHCCTCQVACMMSCDRFLSEMLTLCQLLWGQTLAQCKYTAESNYPCGAQASKAHGFPESWRRICAASWSLHKVCSRLSGGWSVDNGKCWLNSTEAHHMADIHLLFVEQAHRRMNTTGIWIFVNSDSFSPFCEIWSLFSSNPKRPTCLQAQKAAIKAQRKAMDEMFQAMKRSYSELSSEQAELESALGTITARSLRSQQPAPSAISSALSSLPALALLTGIHWSRVPSWRVTISLATLALLLVDCPPLPQPLQSFDLACNQHPPSLCFADR